MVESRAHFASNWLTNQWKVCILVVIYSTLDIIRPVPLTSSQPATRIPIRIKIEQKKKKKEFKVIRANVDVIHGCALPASSCVCALCVWYSPLGAVAVTAV